MLLVTWNVNSLKARLPRVLELIDKHRPDVLLMQETKVTADAFPREELAAAGYSIAEHSAGRWAGVAIVARRGLEPADVEHGLADEPAADEARWIEATVGGLRLATVYVPNGQRVGSEPFAGKLRFLDAMAARLASEHPPDLVAGDFNIAPTDADLYDPAAFIGSTHVTDEERGRLAAMLEAGYVDAFRHLEHAEPGFTWWDYRQGHFHRKLGLRIDLVLVREGLAERVVRCGIDRNFRKGPKPSDHAPLLVELDG